ncbi:MAG: hypothetical protein H7251_10205 [Acetobacteraceae bacterium]|nr:hypothetical protein [Acetobacteraceae bacterium]
MSWFSSVMVQTPGTEDQVSPEIDRVARRLAIAAGADWARMSNYAGVERGRWREMAETMLGTERGEHGNFRQRG